MNRASIIMPIIVKLSYFIFYFLLFVRPIILLKSKLYYNECLARTCSNIDDSESHAVPDANSPAATIDTSTPRGRNSCRRHVAKPSIPACVAHCAPVQRIIIRNHRDLIT